ncbi:MAG: glycerol-3-phosphate dehydrogenase/oxidase [Candidatus Obscuribacterales bacterium]|nr:glycerol-3-phosphate dehydrogenase/oxidase [Cyanobacteria bacterium HKST-UBA01]MCB9469648.1 glycerol-3-phosphate dehydrogenase/oxidase [Candidatus Obscuribacterales bacterium]
MKSRAESLEFARDKKFDLIILGGGIVGAGVAQDAATRGLSVLLLEMEDFSSGTSSKTTKLIHGGLRYLEQFQFRLTRELCHERSLLEHLAPHLVKDFSFVMPVKEENKWFSYKARAGLTLYDILAGQLTSVRRHEKLSNQEVLEAAPSLNPSRLAGGLRFHDCISDDSRMVIEVIKSAEAAGATIINYMEATDFVRTDDGERITAVIARDRYSGTDIKFGCHACVNATGVWSDKLASKMNPEWKSRIVPAKGVHIMVPLAAFETNTALFLPTKDNRYVFVVPWQRALMIGTTDTNYTGPFEDSLPEPEEVDYLLSVVNEYAGSSKLSRADVIAAWAGLRPLVGPADKDMADNSGEATSTLSREHYLFEGPENVVGLIGGKLTNYRILATHVVDKILEKLPREERIKAGPSRTHEVMLGGWEDKNGFLTKSAEISAKGRALGVDPAALDHLSSSYGADALKILALIETDPFLGKRITPDYPPILAEVVFVVKNEMALSLEDILFRRIRLGLVNQEQCQLAAAKVARLVQGVSGWDDQRTQMEINALMTTLDKHMVWTGVKVKEEAV